MKKNMKLLALAAFMVPFFSEVALATKNHDRNMAVTVDPWAFYQEQRLPVSFSFAVSDSISLGLVGYGKFAKSKETDFAFGGGLNAKFHLTNSAFSDGFYVKPEVIVDYANDKNGRLNMQGKLLGGYDWVLKSGLTMGVGLGMQYSHVLGKKDGEEKMSTLGLGVAPTAELSFGWAF